MRCCAESGRRLLYCSSFYFSFLRSYFCILLVLFLFITVETARIQAEDDKKTTEPPQNFDFEAVTTKMIEKIRDQSVERLLKLKLGEPSTSYADSEKELFQEDEEDEEEDLGDEDQNVNNDSLEKISAATSSSSMTPLNSDETFVSTTSPASTLRGRRSLRHSHRRRRKGCPTVHGKTQFLCPTKNSQRYDICITREQLCNHIVDCPGEEDEDPKHCMFYQPIDDQLKTLSHAVLLLVDNVMANNKPKSEL